MGHSMASETRTALWLTALVLVVLTLVKPLGGIPFVGTAAFTIAAVLQLYLPLWRAGKHDRDYDYVGLHLDTAARDAKNVALLVVLTFPLYALGYHLFATRGHEWVHVLGLGELARFVPERSVESTFGVNGRTLGRELLWLLELAATHVFGVALPEETFYRGDLQPRLEDHWPARRRWLGVAVGRAAVLTAFFFALGHFLGEWNPLRMGPFFPALLFAWLRNATGSIAGSIGFHALCNIFGAILFRLYGGYP